MTIRESLHGMLDRLPQDPLSAAELSLAGLEAWQDDPSWNQLLEAEEEDEPLTPDEAARVDRAWGRLKRGELVADGERHRLLS